MKLYLSDLKNQFPELNIVNDGVFTNLGLTGTNFGNEAALSFLNNMKFHHEFEKNKNIKSLICSKEILDVITNKNIGLCIVEDPKAVFYRVHNYLIKQTDFFGTAVSNQINSSATIHPRAFIAEHDVKIGDNVVIEPNAVILPNVEIRANTLIKAGSVIGGGGFQAFRDNGRAVMVQAGGSVIIEENVEIGNNTCIDKGVFHGSTIIRRNAKIDNLVHIGHDAIIGSNCLITANALISGRTVLEENVWIGVSSVVSNGLRIGKDAKITMGAVVTKDVDENQTVSGNFAVDHQKFIQFIRTIR